MTAVVVAIVADHIRRLEQEPDDPSGAAKPSSSASSSTTTSQHHRAPRHVVAQINLTAAKSGSKAAGIAEVLKEGANNGIAIVAEHITPNTTKPPNAYAVWLYNSTSDAQLLGFVNPGVGKNGRLSTAGGLPSNAAHFHQVIVSLETKADPKTPGTIVLHGALSGLFLGVVWRPGDGASVPAAGGHVARDRAEVPTTPSAGAATPSRPLRQRAATGSSRLKTRRPGGSLRRSPSRCERRWRGWIGGRRAADVPPVLLASPAPAHRNTATISTQDPGRGRRPGRHKQTQTNGSSRSRPSSASSSLERVARFSSSPPCASSRAASAAVRS